MDTVLDHGALLVEDLLFRERLLVVLPAPARGLFHGRVHVGDVGVVEDAGRRVVAAEEIPNPLPQGDMGDVSVVIDVWDFSGGFVDCDCVFCRGAYGA